MNIFHSDHLPSSFPQQITRRINDVSYSTMAKSKSTSAKTSKNPLLEQQQAYLATLSQHERNNFFSNTKLDAERRAEMWMDQADLGEALVNQYSWATPDDRAIRVLAHFSPLVEIGCGANAYWCKAMKVAGIDVVGYDVQPNDGGKIDKTHKGNVGFAVKQGGPEVLAHFKDRTLFLCYPDEDVSNEKQRTENEDEDESTATSMAAACLEHFKGEYVVHVGELYGDTPSMEQAPWGRSSGAEFQERLASEYHCLLKASLTNWLHVRDTISVWKRSETCSIVFAADDDDDEEEEMAYKHIPVNERLPTDLAAPCLQHLLGEMKLAVAAPEILPYDDDDNEEEQVPPVTTQNKRPAPQPSEKKSKKRKKKATESQESTIKANDSDYACPW
jgi:hypothetical protein